jgi:hypothetical protein
MFTTAVKGIDALRWVGGTPGNLEGSAVCRRNNGAQHVQPVDFPVMGEFEDELVDHAVNSNCSTDKFEVGVG